jgi:hypothetical protein
MYTRSANEEKIYIKTQTHMKYLFVNIKSRISTNRTLTIAIGMETILTYHFPRNKGPTLTVIPTYKNLALEI